MTATLTFESMAMRMASDPLGLAHLASDPLDLAHLSSDPLDLARLACGFEGEDEAEDAPPSDRRPAK